jgi:hypothetical protein
MVPLHFPQGHECLHEVGLLSPLRVSGSTEILPWQKAQCWSIGSPYWDWPSAIKTSLAPFGIMLNGKKTNSATTVLDVDDGWKRTPQCLHVAGSSAPEVHTRRAFTPCGP